MMIVEAQRHVLQQEGKANPVLVLNRRVHRALLTAEICLEQHPDLQVHLALLIAIAVLVLVLNYRDQHALLEAEVYLNLDLSQSDHLALPIAT